MSSLTPSLDLLQKYTDFSVMRKKKALLILLGTTDVSACSKAT